MGDISELRGIVTIGSFLGILVLLIGWIPYAFYVESYEGRTITTPEYFEAIELEKYATTWNYTLDTTDATLIYDSFWQYRADDLGGYDFYFEYAKANTTVTDWISDEGIIRIRHIDYWWIFEIGAHTMEIFNDGVSKSYALDRTEMNADYSNNDLSYIFQCDHVQMDVFFAFNETAYDSPTEAFDHYDLHLMIGLEWDQVASSMSAWDIIGMLLFFQLPDMHWMVNAIIAIPIWLAVAYLSYILLLRAIGAVFGGGA